MVSKPQKRVLTMRSFLLFVFLGGFCQSLCSQRNCSANDYRDMLLNELPALSTGLLHTERFIQQQIATRERPGTSTGSIAGGLTIIRIPVVVHVLYNAPNENISD